MKKFICLSIIFFILFFIVFAISEPHIENEEIPVEEIEEFELINEEESIPISFEKNEPGKIILQKTLINDVWHIRCDVMDGTTFHAGGGIWKTDVIMNPTKNTSKEGHRSNKCGDADHWIIWLDNTGIPFRMDEIKSGATGGTLPTMIFEEVYSPQDLGFSGWGELEPEMTEQVELYKQNFTIVKDITTIVPGERIYWITWNGGQRWYHSGIPYVAPPTFIFYIDNEPYPIVAGEYLELSDVLPGAHEIKEDVSTEDYIITVFGSNEVEGTTSIINIVDGEIVEVEYVNERITPPTVEPSTPPSLPTATPSPSPIPTETPSPSPTPTETPTPIPSPTSTSTETPNPSPTLTETPTSTPTTTPTPSPSPTPTSSPSPTIEITPSPSPTIEITPSPSPTSTITPSPTPTEIPVPSPTLSPTATSVPETEIDLTVKSTIITKKPTHEPIITPSPSPTLSATPTIEPSPTITISPIIESTIVSTTQPTNKPIIKIITLTPSAIPHTKTPITTKTPTPTPTHISKTPIIQPTKTPETIVEFIDPLITEVPAIKLTPSPSPSPTPKPTSTPQPTLTPEQKEKLIKYLTDHPIKSYPLLDSLSEEELEELLKLFNYKIPLYGALLPTGDEVPLWVWITLSFGIISIGMYFYLKYRDDLH